MKLIDIINKTDDDTRIRVTIKVFGMNFITVHSAEYYANLQGEDRAILNKGVKALAADQDALGVILE